MKSRLRCCACLLLALTYFCAGASQLRPLAMRAGILSTGLRHRSTLSAVTASLGGTPVEVIFAGAQPNFVGLDQLNVRLPRSLAGRGEVNVVVTVDGWTANTVNVNIK